MNDYLKLYQQQLEKNISEVTPRTLFMSKEYRKFSQIQVEATVATATDYVKALGAKVSQRDIAMRASTPVIMEWLKDITAYTDGRTIHVNANSSLVTYSNELEIQHAIIQGMLRHEIGHVLFTDSALVTLWVNDLRDGNMRFQPNELSASDKEVLDKIRNDKAFALMWAQMAKNIENCIEDGYIESELDTVSGGKGDTVRYLSTVNSVMIAQGMENHAFDFDAYTSLLDAIINFILLYAKYGMTIKAPPKIERLFSDLAGVIDKAVSSRQPQKRLEFINKVTLMIYPYIANALNSATQQNNGTNNQPGQNGQSGNGSNSANDNNSKSESSGKGNQPMNGQISQSGEEGQSEGTPTGQSGQENQSGDTQASQSGQGSSSSNDGQGGQSASGNQSGSCSNQSAQSGQTDGQNEQADRESQSVSGSDGENTADSSSEKEESSANKSTNAKDDSQAGAGNDSANDTKTNSKNESTKSNDTLNSSDDTSDIESKNQPMTLDDIRKLLKDVFGSDKDAEKGTPICTSGSIFDYVKKNDAPNNGGATVRKQDGSNTEGGSTGGFGGNTITSDDVNAIIKEMAAAAATAVVENKRQDDLNKVFQNIAKQKKATAPSLASMIQRMSLIRIKGVPDSAEMVYKSTQSTVEPVAKSISKEINRAIKEKRRGYRISGLTMGNRIQANLLYHNDGKIFVRSKLPNDVAKLCVGVLVDESSSTANNGSSGDNFSIITYERILAMTVAKMCQNIDIPAIICGYQADSIKSYVEPETVTKQDILRLTAMRPSGGTPTAPAFAYMLERMKERPEEAKLLFIVTDGESNDAKPLPGLLREAKREKILVIAAGIGSCRANIKQEFPENFLDISDMEQMPRNICNIIKRQLID